MTKIDIIIFTTILICGYVFMAFTVRRAVHCAHVLGYGEAAPRRRSLKIAVLWPWYVATWVLQALYYISKKQ